MVLFRPCVLVLMSVAKLCCFAISLQAAAMCDVLPKSVTTASLWGHIQDAAEYNFLAKLFCVFISVVHMSNDISTG